MNIRIGHLFVHNSVNLGLFHWFVLFVRRLDLFLSQISPFYTFSIVLNCLMSAFIREFLSLLESRLISESYIPIGFLYFFNLWLIVSRSWVLDIFKTVRVYISWKRFFVYFSWQIWPSFHIFLFFEYVLIGI